jgi:hypothetical protein
MLNMMRVLQSNQQVNAKHDEGFALKKIRQKMGMGNFLPNFLFAMFGVNAWYGASF